MRLPALAVSAFVLLLSACASTPPPAQPDPSSVPLPARFGVKALPVPEAFVTAPLPKHEIDSVAAWPAPDGHTWLIATAKETHQLVVYDGDTGEFLLEVGGPGSGSGQFNRPNGIAVFGDLVFVVERDNQRVQVLRLPDFDPVAMIGKEQLRNPYGLWLHELEPGTLELLVTDSFMADYATETLPPMHELAQRVKRYRVRLYGEAVQAEYLGQFGDTSEQGALRMVESLMGDRMHDRLLIAEEDVRVGTTLRVYRMDGAYTGVNLPPERFQAQAEGVALWACADGSGYWITADQHSDLTVFHLFDRASLEFLGSFTGEATALTDGIWLHSVATRRFPYGVLYAAHNDEGVTAFDWQDIARTLRLRSDCQD